MRIVSKNTLREFWESPAHKDAETPLKRWYKTITKNKWEEPNSIIVHFKDADYIGNGLIVFNICHNKYRLIVLFRFRIQIGFVRFIGTHKEYDAIKDIKNI